MGIHPIERCFVLSEICDRFERSERDISHKRIAIENFAIHHRSLNRMATRLCHGHKRYSFVQLPPWGKMDANRSHFLSLRIAHHIKGSI